MVVEPFGYTLDSERKFHIDPLASPFVLESFQEVPDGLTMKEIRDWLNENGIKNPVAVRLHITALNICSKTGGTSEN